MIFLDLFEFTQSNVKVQRYKNLKNIFRKHRLNLIQLSLIYLILPKMMILNHNKFSCKVTGQSVLIMLENLSPMNLKNFVRSMASSKNFLAHTHLSSMQGQNDL